MDKEIWKDIPVFEGEFQISNKGRVLSLCGHRKVLKLRNNKGNNVVDLRRKGVRHMFYVSRLVAEAFIPNPHNKKYVIHKGERNNDCVENLMWSDIATANVDYSKIKSLYNADVSHFASYILEKFSKDECIDLVDIIRAKYNF